MSQDDTTDTTATRWEYTNDVLAAVIVVGFLAIVGYGVVTGSVQIRTNWFGPALVGLVVLAGAWLFGKQGFEAINQLRGR